MNYSSPVVRLLYRIRDLRNRPLFDALRALDLRRVLDVGGGDFYHALLARKLPFDQWTILEAEGRVLDPPVHPRVKLEFGDGCRLSYPDGSFDTVLNIQVLEHVFDPFAMVREMCRVLVPGGHLVLLVPQTSTLHLAPHHYYNFTRFWVEEALGRCHMEIQVLRPMGGIWSSMASHLVYFFLQAARFPSMSSPDIRRAPAFYLLLPAMVLFALVAIPICALLSLGDLQEEPNNHLVIARKRA